MIYRASPRTGANTPWRSAGVRARLLIQRRLKDCALSALKTTGAAAKTRAKAESKTAAAKTAGKTAATKKTAKRTVKKAAATEILDPAPAPFELARPAPSEAAPEHATPSTHADPAHLAKLVVNRLEDDKAEDVLCIDVTGKSSIADFMIIASGRSQRHVGALADHLQRTLKDEGVGRCRVEGLPNCDWVLIDAGDVVVHIFRPEVREFYSIERIWAAGDALGTGHRVNSGARLD